MYGVEDEEWDASASLDAAGLNAGFEVGLGVDVNLLQHITSLYQMLDDELVLQPVCSELFFHSSLRHPPEVDVLHLLPAQLT